MKLSPRLLTFAFTSAILVGSGLQAFGITSLGSTLIGGDLTDPENDGDPQAYTNYNAVFSASEENGFFVGQESAWNVFDNQTGGDPLSSDAKWCCGDKNGFPTNPIFIDATLNAGAFKLTTFTLASGNDSPERDPVLFKIQGSNNGVDFTTIYDHATNDDVWSARNEVLRFDAGTDFPTQATGYNTFRFITTATGASQGNGAPFQLAEIEYFGTPVPEPTTMALGLMSGLGLLALRRRRA